MRRWLRWIADLFRRIWPGRHQYALEPTANVAIEVERLKRQLGVESSGKRDGSKNYPKADAREWSDTEQRIASYMNVAVQSARHNLHKQEQVYNNRLAGLDLAACAAGFAKIPVVAQAQYDSVVRRKKNELHRLEEDVRSLSDELERFKNRNRLERLANYPASRQLSYGFLALLVLAESLLNSYFFAKGNDFGFVGGFFQATIFAGINVLILGFLLGRVCAPNVHHRNWLRALAGAASVVGMTCVAVLFNLWVAHYREAVALHPFDAAQNAVVNFRNTPGGLSLFDSWMLLIVGCAWIGLAAFDWYRMDDPYPGYGKLDLRRRTKEDEYLQDVDDTLKSIDNIRENALRELEEAPRLLNFRRQQYQGLVGQLSMEFARYANYLKHAEHVGNLLIAAYREANRSSRSEAAPVYFDHDLLRFPFESEDSPETSAPRHDVDRIVIDALGKLEEHRSRVLASAQNAAEQFKSLAYLSTPASGAERP